MYDLVGKKYNQSPLIGTLRRLQKAPVLKGCPYKAGWIERKYKNFLSPGTKETVCNNEVSVLSRLNLEKM